MFFWDSDSDPAKTFGFFQIRIHNTGGAEVATGYHDVHSIGLTSVVVFIKESVPILLLQRHPDYFHSCLHKINTVIYSSVFKYSDYVRKKII
jgi:hypothetical protein